ncbi:hypothetical protein GCM10022291_23420 [Postechiella marina]|uniref:Uncharacterized protein n=1 Tax=Postechiella marina TaxID=943941 RepID=A0ABP8CBN0_9FLAO
MASTKILCKVVITIYFLIDDVFCITNMIYKQTIIVRDYKSEPAKNQKLILINIKTYDN